MGEAFIVRRGGGGAGLNFSVKAFASVSALPSVKRENTIAVITDTEITSWIFSATRPTSPTAGMVWFQVGTSSAVAFNALKKNGIQVYPISAKQYVSGAWVNKTAKSYQDGKWVEWIPEGALYYEGNELASKTGGWKAVSGTITKNTGYLVVNQNSICTTTNKISTVGYKKITIKAKTTAKQWFGLGTANNSFAGGQVELPQNSVGTVFVDLTGLQGSYYPIFACGTDSGAKIEVYEVVMTK